MASPGFLNIGTLSKKTLKLSLFFKLNLPFTTFSLRIFFFLEFFNTIGMS